MRRFGNWLVALWRWLGEGKVIFMCLLVLAAAMSLGGFALRTEASSRVAGFVLQLLGMVFAIRGLLGVRVHFGHEPLRTLFVDWLKRFPRWQRNTVISMGAANMGSMTGMKASLEVWAKDDSTLALEQRVERLVNNLERVRTEQRHHAELIDNLRSEHEEHKKLVADQTKNLEHDLRSDLEKIHTSDLITSLVGLVWLTAGIIMSTLAPELAQWLFVA